MFAKAIQVEQIERLRGLTKKEFFETMKKIAVKAAWG
jgi:hypothetical protein